eukprot:6908815-Pyramimonas_sp.AAC.1
MSVWAVRVAPPRLDPMTTSLALLRYSALLACTYLYFAGGEASARPPHPDPKNPPTPNDHDVPAM